MASYKPLGIRSNASLTTVAERVTERARHHRRAYVRSFDWNRSHGERIKLLKLWSEIAEIRDHLRRHAGLPPIDDE